MSKHHIDDQWAITKEFFAYKREQETYDSRGASCQEDFGDDMDRRAAQDMALDYHPEEDHTC